MRRLIFLALLAAALVVVLGAGASSRSEPLSAGAESVRSGIDHATIAARGSVESPRAGLAILPVVILIAIAGWGVSTARHARRIPVVTAHRDRSRAPPPA